MALGFTLADGITIVRPDRNMTKRAAPKVLLASFGDNYEQRLADGINNIDYFYDVAFVNRDTDEVDEIIYFFDTMKGTTPFEFTIPNSREVLGEETVTVVCESWDQIYTNHIANGCVARFRRVYE